MPAKQAIDVTEQKRLNEARDAGIPWKKWGPYLSERQWGTVREDYSQDGNAWDYFSHDQSRSRAYRWGEDGLGGICDDKQRLCFALALWNERDPILKERLFGLTNSEGNHGEDVKEYYFYIDSTPTHSYMKYLYKYPQREFPYRDLVETNRSRSREEFEYELLDTGIFDDDRYFDVFVEYAKGRSRRRTHPHHRSQSRAGAARLRRAADAVVPEHLVVGRESRSPRCARQAPGVIQASHPDLGDYWLYCDGEPGVAVHGKRDKYPASLGTAECFCLGQGCVSLLRHLRRRRSGKSGSRRDQSRCPLRARSARRRQQGSPPAAHSRHRPTTHSAALKPAFKKRVR